MERLFDDPSEHSSDLSLQIVYLPVNDSSWQVYRCMTSGRKEFDREEADKKCFMLVRDRHAMVAKAVDEMGERLQWVLNPRTNRPQKIIRSKG